VHMKSGSFCCCKRSLILVRVNGEEHQDLPARFNIGSIPAVKLLVKEEVKGGFACPPKPCPVFAFRT
jgi:hypothetical protein